MDLDARVDRLERLLQSQAPMEPDETRDKLAEIRQFQRALRVRWRKDRAHRDQVMVVLYSSGWTLDEIANATGYTRGHVYMTIHPPKAKP